MLELDRKLLQIGARHVQYFLFRHALPVLFLYSSNKKLTRVVTNK